MRSDRARDYGMAFHPHFSMVVPPSIYGLAASLYSAQP